MEKLDGWTKVCRRRWCGYSTKWPAVLCLVHMHAGPIHHPGGCNLVGNCSLSRLASRAMKLLVTQQSDLTSVLKLDFLTCGTTIHHDKLPERNF